MEAAPAPESISSPVSDASAPTPPRRRAKRGELSRARVLQAALTLLEREGEGSLSMRRVAAELGSAPMSLYRHVRDKADLVDGVIGLALADLTTEGPRGETWHDRALAWMHALRNEMNDHPAIVPLFRSNHMMLPALLGPVEILMQDLLDAKIPKPRAAKAAWELLWFVISFTVIEQMARGEQPLAVMTFASAQQHADDLPLIAEALPEFTALDADDIFESSARNIVSGLRAEIESAA